MVAERRQSEVIGHHDQGLGNLESEYGTTGSKPVTCTICRSPPQMTGQEVVDTLSIDVGGTGIKASVLDLSGQMEHARVRVETPYPLPPQRLIGTIADLVGATVL